MQHVKHVVLTICAVLALAASLGSSQTIMAAAPNDNGVIPGQYIVTLKPDVADPVGLAHRFARAEGTTPTHVYQHALKGFAVTLPPQAVAKLEANPSVASVTPDRVVLVAGHAAGKNQPPPPPSPPQPLQTLPTGIDRIDAEQSRTAKIDGVDERVDVDVAVLDSGIESSHPDLNVVGGMNCGKGTSYEDYAYHGTHVAGTIGALDNGIGAVGVAPGARLWAVKVLTDEGFGSTAMILCGIDWVTAHADTIEVANMSLGDKGTDDGNCGYSKKDPMHQAICQSVAAGVTYVVAAGNDSQDAAEKIPAAYDEVITVSALADFNGQPGGGAAPSCRFEVDDTLADFSNYGADVDIAAPGVCNYSTTVGNGYRYMDGTSSASPHVAGAAALYKARNPGASPADIRAAIIAAAEPGPTGDDPDMYPEGVLNVKDF